MQFRPRAGIVASLLPGLWDRVQLVLILTPWSIRLQVVSGRIRARIAVLQRRHGGAQYGFSLSAAEKRGKTVGVADGNGLVADLSKVARAIWKEHGENLVRARDLRVLHDRCICGVPIPFVERGDQGMPCRLLVANGSGARRCQTPGASCLLLRLRILEIIR